MPQSTTRGHCFINLAISLGNKTFLDMGQIENAAANRFLNSSSQSPAGGGNQLQLATPGKGTANKVAKSRMQSLYWTCEKVWHGIAE